MLPYADVRTAPDPDALLLEFLGSTHEAAAATGHWPAPGGGQDDEEDRA